MKVTTILGSPRKKGNTAKVLTWCEGELVDRGHEVDRLNIADLEVKGCLGCGTCQEKPDEPGCVQKDDALRVFERMMAADAVIYTSPLYC
jgi:multimeric flavodoxin WrbA